MRCNPCTGVLGRARARRCLFHATGRPANVTFTRGAVARASFRTEQISFAGGDVDEVITSQGHTYTNLLIGAPSPPSEARSPPACEQIGRISHIQQDQCVQDTGPFRLPRPRERVPDRVLLHPDPESRPPYIGPTPFRTRENSIKLLVCQDLFFSRFPYTAAGA